MHLTEVRIVKILQYIYIYIYVEEKCIIVYLCKRKICRKYCNGIRIVIIAHNVLWTMAKIAQGMENSKSNDEKPRIDSPENFVEIILI